MARYDRATRAYMLNAGLGTQWRDIFPQWDVGIRFALNVARDHVLATDVQGGRADSFYKSQTSYVTRRF